MFWEDVDGDGINELLVLTIFPDKLDKQHLYIYRANKVLEEMSALDGVINGEDGVGIKWNRGNNEFRLFVGIPDDGDMRCQSQSIFSCITLNRRFQTYRWDKATNKIAIVTP